MPNAPVEMLLSSGSVRFKPNWHFDDKTRDWILKGSCHSQYCHSKRTVACKPNLSKKFEEKVGRNGWLNFSPNVKTALHIPVYVQQCIWLWKNDLKKACNINEVFCNHKRMNRGKGKLKTLRIHRIECSFKINCHSFKTSIIYPSYEGLAA